MAVIDKYAVLHRAFAAAASIKDVAAELSAQSTAVPFNFLESRLDDMRNSYLSGIQPLLSLGNAATVNPVVAAFFVGAPADSYAQFTLLGTTLTTFYTAYDVVFDTLVPINFSPATGHTFAIIPLAQLATLSDELAAIVAAVAPLA